MARLGGVSRPQLHDHLVLREERLAMIAVCGQKVGSDRTF
jgi:hypothetical protein